jgi:hypothetical protein
MRSESVCPSAECAADVAASAVAVKPDTSRAQDPSPQEVDHALADQLEAERRRMAALIQSSVIDPLNLLLAQTHAYEQTLGAHPPTRTALAVLSSLARQVLQHVRDLEEALRPAVLDALGLEPALEALASQTRRNYGSTVVLAAERLRDLVQQALRMYPERLIVGELRGAELWPLIQAINNGHHGTMATMHAASPRDALARLEVMATASDPAIPLLNVREQLASALDLIVQITRLADGTRRITQIAEVQRLEREAIAIQDLFTFIEGPRDGEQIHRRFAATDQIPTFLTVLKQRGVELRLDIFKQP